MNDLSSFDVTHRTDMTTSGSGRGMSLDRPVYRSTDMFLMNETLARAHCMERREQAERERRVQRLLAARRMERRAIRAAQRARRLAAAAVALSNRPY